MTDVDMPKFTSIEQIRRYYNTIYLKFWCIGNIPYLCNRSLAAIKIFTTSNIISLC